MTAAPNRTQDDRGAGARIKSESTPQSRKNIVSCHCVFLMIKLHGLELWRALFARNPRTSFLSSIRAQSPTAGFQLRPSAGSSPFLVHRLERELHGDERSKRLFRIGSARADERFRQRNDLSDHAKASIALIIRLRNIIAEPGPCNPKFDSLAVKFSLEALNKEWRRAS